MSEIYLVGIAGGILAVLGIALTVLWWRPGEAKRDRVKRAIADQRPDWDVQ